jgi:hypothetical protein
MNHSIAAKYAARPAAHFVRPSVRTKERRLGLHAGGAFRSTAEHATVLRGPDITPLASLRGRSRSIQTADSARPLDGRPRPRVAMTWARSGHGGALRRPSAASAPWRG